MYFTHIKNNNIKSKMKNLCVLRVSVVNPLRVSVVNAPQEVGVTKRARRSGLGLGWVLILSFTTVKLFACVSSRWRTRRAGVGTAPSPSGREVALTRAYTPKSRRFSAT
jgi:hypothetical protein